jgi:thiol-disulfide isomerase/thioredoxin
VAVNRRVLAVSLGVAVVVSIAGGWALSRDDGGTEVAADDDVVLSTPGVVQQPSDSTNEVVTGAALPAVALETNAGDAVSTSDLIGQPLILNFWYSTCAPCKKELPDFATVHAELGDRIRFVGINPYDVPEVNESFARDLGIRYELLRDVADRFGSEVGIATAPFTLFVRADGTIQRQAGLLDEATLRQYAEELLG